MSAVTERLCFGSQAGRARLLSRPVKAESADAQPAPLRMDKTSRDRGLTCAQRRHAYEPRSREACTRSGAGHVTVAEELRACRERLPAVGDQAYLGELRDGQQVAVG